MNTKIVIEHLMWENGFDFELSILHTHRVSLPLLNKKYKYKPNLYVYIHG